MTRTEDDSPSDQILDHIFGGSWGNKRRRGRRRRERGGGGEEEGRMRGRASEDYREAKNEGRNIENRAE